MVDFQYRLNSGAWQTVTGATLPYTLSAQSDDQVEVRGLGESVMAGAYQPDPPAVAGPVRPVALLSEAQASFLETGGWDTAAGVSYAGGALVSDGAQFPGSAVNIYHPFTEALPAGAALVSYTYLSQRAQGTVFSRLGSNVNLGQQVSVPRHILRTGVAAGEVSSGGLRLNQRLVGEIESCQFYNLQPALEAPADIFIFAGQSNMAGASSASGYALADHPPLEEVVFVPSVSNDAFGSVTDGKGPAVNAALTAAHGIGAPTLMCHPLQMAGPNVTDGMSPAVAIMQRLLARGLVGAGRTALALGAARGATSFVGDNGAWSYPGNPNAVGGETGELTDLMRAQVDAILARHPESRVAGLFWCQGESDSATGYAPMFKAFADWLRSAYGAFPIVIMEPGEGATHPNAVARKLEQEKLATGSGDVSELSDCVFVPRPAGAALEADGIHFTGTTNTQRGIDAGNAFADAFG